MTKNPNFHLRTILSFLIFVLLFSACEREKVAHHIPSPPDSMVISDLIPEDRFLVSSDTRAFVEAIPDETKQVQIIGKGAGCRIELIIGMFGNIESLVFEDDADISSEPLRNIKTRDGKILLGDEQNGIIQDWFSETEHMFLGDVRIGPYQFKSDRKFPLTFQVVKGKGYVYLCGRGTVQKDGSDPVELGSKQVALDWIESLKTGDVLQKEGAAQALGWYNVKNTLPTLINATKDTSSWKVRRNAVEALGRLADPSAEQALVDALADEKIWVRAVALESLAKIGKSGLPHIEKSLSDEKSRKMAIYALRASPCEEAVQLLSSLINDKDSNNSRTAIRSLGRLAKPSCLPILLEIIKNNPDGDSRAIAIDGLSAFQEPQSTDAILAALGDKDKNVRLRAIKAVAKLKDQRSLPVLKELAAKDQEAEIKKAANEALSKTK